MLQSSRCCTTQASSPSLARSLPCMRSPFGVDLKPSFPLSSPPSPLRSSVFSRSLLLTLNLCRVYFCFLWSPRHHLWDFFLFPLLSFLCVFIVAFLFGPGLIRLNAVAISLWGGGRVEETSSENRTERAILRHLCRNRSGSLCNFFNMLNSTWDFLKIS